MDLTLYEKVLGATSSKEGYMKDTISVWNEEFDKATTYREIKVDGLDDECIFKRTDKSDKLDVLFRPLRVLNKGMYIHLDGRDYMTIDFIQNEIYPKSEIQLCNNTLRWRDTFGTLKEYGCIVTGANYKFVDGTGNEKFALSSDAEISILVQYNNDTKSIKPKNRFVFGDYAYDVVSVDSLSNVYDGKGYIELIVKSTELTSTDDTDTGVADESGNSGWGEW